MTKVKLLIMVTCLPLLMLLANASSEIELVFTYRGTEPSIGAITTEGELITPCELHSDGSELGLSPNGEMLAMVRYSLDSEPPRLDGTGKTASLSLLNLQTCENTIIREEQAAAISVVWSPDSQRLLIHKLIAIAPLWVGYNYGFLSVYDVEDNSITDIERTLVFGLDWFPDNESILLWNDTEGYLRYDVHDGSTTSVVLPDVRDDVLRSIDMASNLVAYTTEVGINVFDLENNKVVSNLLFSDLEGLSISRLQWSPNGRLLMIEQSDDNIVVWDFHRNLILSSFGNPAMENPTGYSFQLDWSLTSESIYVVVYRRDDSIDIYKGNVETGEFARIQQLK